LSSPPPPAGTATPMSGDAAAQGMEEPRRWGLVLGVTGLMAGARAMDLLSTRILDRSLAGEQNLLHQAFGAGLDVLVAVNLAVVAGLAFLVARSVRLQPRVQPAPPGLGLNGFLSAFLFAGEHPWWTIAWRRPGRTRARWLLGRMVPWPTVGISVLAVVGNGAAHSGEPYASVWGALIGSPARLLATFTAFILLVLAAWLLWEYALYRLSRRAARQA
ncbi:MAG: hypothetical protein ABR586_10940, partial [Thermoplasmatota archaeon]